MDIAKKNANNFSIEIALMCALWMVRRTILNIFMDKYVKFVCAQRIIYITSTVNLFFFIVVIISSIVKCMRFNLYSPSIQTEQIQCDINSCKQRKQNKPNQSIDWAVFPGRIYFILVFCMVFLSLSLGPFSTSLCLRWYQWLLNAPCAIIYRLNSNCSSTVWVLKLIAYHQKLNARKIYCPIDYANAWRIISKLSINLMLFLAKNTIQTGNSKGVHVHTNISWNHYVDK